jgi:hypothetical protein
VSTAKYLHDVNSKGKIVQRDILELVRSEAGASKGVPEDVALEADAAAIFAKFTGKKAASSKATTPRAAKEKAIQQMEVDDEDEDTISESSPRQQRTLRSSTAKPPVPSFTEDAAAQQLIAMGGQTSSIASRIGSRQPPAGRGQPTGSVARLASEAARAAGSDLKRLRLDTSAGGRASTLQSPSSTMSGKSIEQLEDENRKLQAQLRMQVSTTEMLQSALTRTGESGPAAIERRRVYAQQLELIWEACRTAYTASIAVDTSAVQGIRSIANTVATEYRRFRIECGFKLAGDYAWNENISVDASLD